METAIAVGPKTAGVETTLAATPRFRPSSAGFKPKLEAKRPFDVSVLHAPYISAWVRRVVIPITDSRQSPVYVESVCKYLSGSNYAKEFAYRLVAQPLAERDEKENGKRCADLDRSNSP